MTHEAPRRRPTILDVAKAAHVSRQTVSNVVNAPHRVRPETRDRVQAEIERLGYLASTAAQSLRAQRAGAVGIEVSPSGPRSRNATTGPVLAELAVTSPAYDFHMVPFGSRTSAPSLEGYQEMWRSQKVDAFVIADTHHGDPRPDWLARHKVPFASFGRVWDDPTFTRWVDVDGRAGVARATDHCVRRGYAAIGYLGWPSGSDVGDERRKGWVDACRKHGRSVAVSDTSPQLFAPAIEAADRLIPRVGVGGAIVCASDLLALGVREAVLRLGLRPGLDIGIVGFDNSDLAEMHGISSVDQPFHEIADQLLSLVDAQLTSGASPADGHLITPGLEVRASTNPAPEPR